MKSAFALALLALAACAAGQASQTITEIVAASGSGLDSDGKDFDLLLALVQRAGLAETLAGGEFTVFAPNDQAFLDSLKDLEVDGADTEAAAAEKLDELLELVPAGAEESLKELLLYHVVPGKLMSTDVLAATEFTTATTAGQKITRGNDGDDDLELTDLAPALQNPKIITPDIEATNGVVHVIDRVLWNIPASPAFIAGAGGAGGNTTTGATTAASTTAADGAATTSASATTSADDADADEDDDDDDSICFPASAVVHTPDGRDLPIARLAAGDAIKTDTDADAHSPVYLFSHRQLAGEHDFVRVEAESGHAITLSADHYLYANGALKAADAVRVGDVLSTLDGPSRVARTSVVREAGLFAPHTMQGDIVVNGVKASTYTRVVHPTVAHFVLAPLRALARMGVVEPLGAMLYDGAPRLAKLMPKGH